MTQTTGYRQCSNPPPTTHTLRFAVSWCLTSVARAPFAVTGAHCYFGGMCLSKRVSGFLVLRRGCTCFRLQNSRDGWWPQPPCDSHTHPHPMHPPDQYTGITSHFHSCIRGGWGAVTNKKSVQHWRLVKWSHFSVLNEANLRESRCPG